MTKYYCGIFHFAPGSGRANLSSDTENVCMAIASVLCSEKKQTRYWTKEPYKDHNIQENFMRDVRMSEPNNNKKGFALG
jgi:hypothetical protein